jgi:hypothetical protein
MEIRKEDETCFSHQQTWIEKILGFSYSARTKSKTSLEAIQRKKKSRKKNQLNFANGEKKFIAFSVKLSLLEI